MNTTDNATLLRRLGAMIYDTVLAGFSIVIVSSIPASIFQSLTGYRVPDTVMVVIYTFLTYLFFTWFWTHGGQTLGMRAWKIKVLDLQGNPITQRQASLRFIWASLSWAALGIGFLVSLVDKERLTWHDRHSDTRLIQIKTAKSWLKNE